MAKGKSTFCTWYCSECNSANYINAYNKRNNDAIGKEFSKFCSSCRGHFSHRRKDTKKG